MMVKLLTRQQDHIDLLSRLTEIPKAVEKTPIGIIGVPIGVVFCFI